MKNSEVIEKILNYHPYIPDYKGCDEFKCGNPDDECTGIVSCLVPTVETIREAIKLNCNLIITHEVLYYQTPDFPDWKGCFENSIQKEKQKLIEDNKITIWRDHDHMHAHTPDSIFSGVIKHLGWEQYQRMDLPGASPIFMPFDLPKTTVKELCKHLVDSIEMNGLRYVGNPDDEISRVAIVAHLYPNSFEEDRIEADGTYHDYAMTVMELMENNNVDVILPGEIIEWTVLSYIRDAVQLGKTKALINLGHFNWEELGMKEAANWLRDITDNAVPVHYVPSGDPYNFI